MRNGRSAAAGTRIMDHELRTWDLYNLFEALAPESLNVMRDLFRHIFSLSGKEVGGLPYDAIQISWCAFIL